MVAETFSKTLLKTEGFIYIVFQAFTAKYMRTAHCWVVTQRVVVISYLFSGQPIGPIFKDKESKKKGNLDP